MNRTDQQLHIHFDIDGADARLTVASVSGQEALSSPFCFDVRFAVSGGRLDPDAAVGSNACLTIGQGESAMRRRGVITQIEHGEIDSDGTCRYRVTLAPLHWPLSLTRRSRLFQGLSVPQILEQYLVVEAGLRVRFELHRNYPTRETISQYQEADLDFVSRLLEHEGISYFYEHGTDEDVLVVTDDTTALNQASLHVAHRGDCQDTASVRDLRCRRRPIPRRIVLRDYDERIPHVPLQGEAEIDPQGRGTLAEHGAGFRTPEEGAAMAAIRAQEQRCRGSEYSGALAGCVVAPGSMLSVSGHAQFGEPILVVSLQHRLTRNGDGAWQHRCEFSGVSADTPYRPRRVTPVPKVHGTMSAHAAGRDGRADMDDQGRYRVRLPFEMDPLQGDASGFLRMAQPSAGTDQGMHFPLEPGSEVLWSCIGGDPDRPVITAAVPRVGDAVAEAPEKTTRSFIRTPGGTTLEFGNTAPTTDADARMVSSGVDDMGLQPALEQRHQQTSGTTTDLASAQAMDASGGTGVDDQAGGSTKWFKVKVPDYSGTKDSYLRMGKADTTEAPEDWFFSGDAFSAGTGQMIDGTNPTDADGTFDYTDGNRVQITQGKREVYIQEKSRVTIGGGGLGTWDAGSTFLVNFRKVGTDAFGVAIWRKTTIEHSSSDSYTWGDSESFHAGFSFDGSLSLSTSISIGGSIGVSVATSASLSFGVDMGYSWGVDWKGSGGGSARLSPDTESSGAKTNKINVKPLAEATKQATTKGLAAGIVSGIGLVGAAVGGGVGAGFSQSDEPASAVPLSSAIGLGGGLLGLATAGALKMYASQKAAPAVTEIALGLNSIKMGMTSLTHNPGVHVKSGSVKLVCGLTSIEITNQEIKLKAPKISLTSGGSTEISTMGTATIKSTGVMKVESSAMTNVKGQVVFLDGAVVKTNNAPSL